ncbi:hypothetical protein FRC07_007416 [Ceratobasidium sp. 392]|nr:hypothetical protein FRC07_007416 [Ceratobasidium sp. 392]
MFRLTASAILRAAYGYEVESLDDQFVVSIKKVVEIVSEIALPSNNPEKLGVIDFLVNVIPSLVYVPEWFPGTDWKRNAQAWRAEKDRVLDDIFAWTKNQMAQGIAKPSMLRSMLENIPESKFEDPSYQEEIAKEVAFTLFGGQFMVTEIAVPHTAGTLMAFVLAMARFPEVQAKAQREIDGVVGSGRLPEMNDKPNLPYICNLVQEVLRWRPVVPMGVPHASSQDDTFNNYLIPKGSIM